jgi:hypothetical protein
MDQWIVGGSVIFTVIIGLVAGIVLVTWLALPFIVWAKLSSIDYSLKHIKAMLQGTLAVGFGINVTTKPKTPQRPSTSQVPCNDVE